MTCNTHIRTRVTFHVHKHIQSYTHTRADTLSLFQWFVGWHFLGLLSLHELFTHPPSLAVSNTDLMGRKKDRQTEREREQSGRYLVRCSQAKSGSQTKRQTAWEWCQDLNFYFTPNQPSSFKHQTRINRAPVKERPRSSEESQCSLMRVPC